MGVIGKVYANAMLILINNRMLLTTFPDFASVHLENAFLDPSFPHSPAMRFCN